VVVQSAAQAQDYGFGFMGQGTEVSTVRRVYNDFLGVQVQNAQASKSGLDSYYAQIKQIDNLLADPTSGLSPTLQDFFAGVQELSSNPTSLPSRQAALSSAESLASRFQSLAGRLDEMKQGVNTQIQSSVGVINAYAEQIAKLNDAISKVQRADGQPANDLLDQRDQLILDLNKEIKVTVVKQGDNNYNVFIGNGQALVVGMNTAQLTTQASATNPEKIEVAYLASNGSVVSLGETGLTGGKLGGLIEFRSKTLEPAQNGLGRVAVGLASTFNAQHRRGVDLNGAAGGTFFTAASPVVTASTRNDDTSTAAVTASIGNANALTTSDYRLQYDGTNYTLTRLSDNTTTSPITSGQTVDGMTLSLSGTAVTGDSFLIRPTVNGASGLRVAISDPAKIAAAATVAPTTANGTNSGSGLISAATVDSTYTQLGAALTLTYSSGTNELSGFPSTQAVTVTSGGIPTVYSAGTPVPYTADATISFGGVSFTMSGIPADGDTFTVTPSISGVGDNRNALLLGALQTANTLGNGTANYQNAYSQIVSQIGNKTRELEVTSNAAGKLLSEATLSVQNESGVNLDEEAANLLRYQQAYQAAGKVMQIASELFNVLLSLGGR
jgi:flagellar hook-associated protein 1 FlgK